MVFLLTPESSADQGKQNSPRAGGSRQQLLPWQKHVDGIAGRGMREKERRQPPKPYTVRIVGRNAAWRGKGAQRLRATGACVVSRFEQP